MGEEMYTKLHELWDTIDSNTSKVIQCVGVVAMAYYNYKFVTFAPYHSFLYIVELFTLSVYITLEKMLSMQKWSNWYVLIEHTLSMHLAMYSLTARKDRLCDQHMQEQPRITTHASYTHALT